MAQIKTTAAFVATSRELSMNIL